MPKQVKHTDWTAKARLAVIRKQNVARHAGYEAKQKLRQNIIRHQVNHTHQLEYDKAQSSYCPRQSPCSSGSEDAAYQEHLG